MIGVKLQGRMGNQMFQFAFAYVTSKKRGKDFFISKGSSKWGLGYFVLNGYSFHPFKNRLRRILYSFSHLKPKVLYQLGPEDITAVLKESADSDELDGYFQSELFFAGHEQEIKKLFELKEEYKTPFEKKYGEFFRANKTIVVHIRRTDYLTWDRGARYGTSSALPFSYAESCLEKFNLAEYKVIFISDDINAVKEHFGLSPDFYFESNTAIVDFQILLHADILCLSNSSFSWWGAYLNPKTGKQVFVPEYWLGMKTAEEFPNEVVCKGWQRLAVEL